MNYIYENLGIHWASSMPAFLALACLPAPFFFYKHGTAIWAQSSYAVESKAAIRSIIALEIGPSYEALSYHDARGTASINEGNQACDEGLGSAGCQVQNGTKEVIRSR